MYVLRHSDIMISDIMLEFPIALVGFINALPLEKFVQFCNQVFYAIICFQQFRVDTGRYFSILAE